jgi:C_GCAxxG_C_C family probable redox protein
MEKTLQRNTWTREHNAQVTLARGLKSGLIGGIAGTLVMDFVLMGALSAVGIPSLTCFSIVGDTVEHLFANLSITLAGGVLTVIVAHYLVGPLSGIIFGALLVKVKAMHVDTLKKGIFLAVLYVEIMSQPILAMTPILLKMTTKDTLLWFGASFVMHFLYGVVLGAIVSYGLRFWDYRRLSLGNLLRMGHCAPTVMQSILDISSTEKEWLVKLSAGMPGGIGNTGFECGAVTSPLALLGIRYGLREDEHGLPVTFDKGHALCQHFHACYNTLHCREIRGKDRFPRHCIGPVTRSPELFLAALDGYHQDTIPAARRASYSRLYSHMVENDFHCA